MVTEAQIKAKYKAWHDTLSESYYDGTSGLSKEDFDHQHGNVWADMDSELIAEGFKAPAIPPRDLAVELDELKARVGKLEPSQ
jgi:hypothetical protein